METDIHDLLTTEAEPVDNKQSKIDTDKSKYRVIDTDQSEYGITLAKNQDPYLMDGEQGPSRELAGFYHAA